MYRYNYYSRPNHDTIFFDGSLDVQQYIASILRDSSRYLDPIISESERPTICNVPYDESVSDELAAVV